MGSGSVSHPNELNRIPSSRRSGMTFPASDSVHGIPVTSRQGIYGQDDAITPLDSSSSITFSTHWSRSSREVLTTRSAFSGSS